MPSVGGDSVDGPAPPPKGKRKTTRSDLKVELAKSNRSTCKGCNSQIDKVCVYVCMYMYVYVCICMYMYVLYVCMYCMYVCMYVCICACVYVCMYVCMYTLEFTV